jgi:predicted nuclease of predicted toxin-antitoxin system
VKLLADEGVDALTVARLRTDGHDVTYVAELAPGIGDDAVLDLANAEARALLTADKDFGELVFRLRHLPLGVLPSQTRRSWFGGQGRDRLPGRRRTW